VDFVKISALKAMLYFQD